MRCFLGGSASERISRPFPLVGLKAEYRNRRDTLVDNLLDVSHAELDARSVSAQSGLRAFEVWTRPTGKEVDEKFKGAGQKLLSFVAPVGGMFGGLLLWFRLLLLVS